MIFSRGNTALSVILLLLGIFSSSVVAQSVGVCYGRNGNNLPTDQASVDLYKSNRIGKLRLYDPNEGALAALKGSNIEVILGVPNDQLQSLTNAAAATNWVNKAQFLQPTCKTKSRSQPAIDTTLLGKSYPPKDGVFSNDASSYISPIINFLKQNGAPLLANVYPYFAYVNNQKDIGLDYALFTKQGNNEVGYQNLFDALLDSLYASLEKVGASNMKIVVAESGWPSEGGTGASVQNAQTYYSKLISHAKGGTPKRPNGPIETYLFAMFDENQKRGAETERHFGLFKPDKTPKYQLSFA
ncbi:hypothetical protein Fmac_022627 [Flemingia macrophylla]|uniref:glucan endo-1,3-beta-D-glucosidase n=1 Tax=Flemingia macrophylla TaxID=520843 RepID=A0ABD1M0A6_9FABA